jgi:hypothetical protein
VTAAGEGDAPWSHPWPAAAGNIPVAAGVGNPTGDRPLQRASVQVSGQARG